MKYLGIKRITAEDERNKNIIFVIANDSRKEWNSYCNFYNRRTAIEKMIHNRFLSYYYHTKIEKAP